MSEEKHSLRDRLAPALPTVLLILLILQPLLDILSYWTDRLGMANTLTLLLRFAVFAAVCLLGFLASSRKKAYGIAAGACIFVLVGHVIACSIKGYLDPVHDLTNFVRVVQMPLFALCFISFLRANKKCYPAMETALIVNFWVISVTLVISVLTNTAAATYTNSGIGLLGWFSTSNAQSAVVSMLAPIVIAFCYRKKHFWLFCLTTAAAFAQLYILGTRLAVLSLFAVALGTARGMSAYEYSDQGTDITATRHRKIVFCSMLMDEHPFVSRIFGMELSRMSFDGDIYDVENDFHGIYFLYGWAGLALMVAFVAYFLYLIAKFLIQDFRKYFTSESGAYGISLCLCLIYANCTAGMLRRPNASVYMSVLLAAVYYLTQMRSEQPDALPDGEEKTA